MKNPLTEGFGYGENPFRNFTISNSEKINGFKYEKTAHLKLIGPLPSLLLLKTKFKMSSEVKKLEPN